MPKSNEKCTIKIPKHSAYRSGILVKSYKKAFAIKYGDRVSPYDGEKPSKRNKGLKRWFAEKWRNQRGKVGYQKKGDVYRPTVRVTKHTPLTYKELSTNEIKLKHNVKRKKGVGYVAFVQNNENTF